MKTVKIIIVSLLLCFSAIALANPTSTKIPLKGTRFVSYYQAPVTKDSPATLNVVFYGSKPSAVQVEKFLRGALSMTLTVEGQKDILAHAWYSKTGSELDEDMLAVGKEGTTALIYVAADKSIKPFRLSDSKHNE